MKWITRARPKIDRIACPWLIARFIDKEPEFLFWRCTTRCIHGAATRRAKNTTGLIRPCQNQCPTGC